MQRLLLQSLARKKERLLGSNFALVQHAFDAFFVNIACAWAGLQDLALKDDDQVEKNPPLPSPKEKVPISDRFSNYCHSSTRLFVRLTRHRVIRAKNVCSR